MLLEPWMPWWAQQRDGDKSGIGNQSLPKPWWMRWLCLLNCCSADTGGCPEPPLPLGAAGGSFPIPYSGEAQEMLQLFQHYPSCEQHFCCPHLACRLSEGVAGDSSLTCTQVGCTPFRALFLRMQSMLHFPPWWCFSFLSSCLSLFSPSSVIQFILSLTGFHFLYKYIAFSLASWLWKGFNTLLSPHLLFFCYYQRLFFLFPVPWIITGDSKGVFLHSCTLAIHGNKY